MLAVCRVIAGIGVGGSIPSVFTLYTEYLPTHRRGMLLSIVAGFWTIGTIYTAGSSLELPLCGRLLSAVCVSSLPRLSGSGPACWPASLDGKPGLAWLLLGKLNLSWHVFAIGAACPAILAVLLVAVYLPESPRYSTHGGRC